MSNSKPLIIPIFIPHSGCPHQCAFCNQSIITDNHRNPVLPSTEEIRQIVNSFMAYKGSRKEVQVAFFGGNFLGLKPDEITMLLSSARELVSEGIIDSIRFSTRPDTITKERLELIAPYPVSTIEIGVQSMNDTVLEIARRGHTAEDTIRAASLLKDFPKFVKDKKNSSIGMATKPFTVGMQMMVGLPGDSSENAPETCIESSGSLETAEKIAKLNPAFVRIYPLIVLEGSLMAKWYREGKYQPMSLDSCVKLVKEIFLIFQKHNIPVIRMGLQASDLLQDKLSMVAGPWHPAFGHLIYSEIFFDKAVDLIGKELSAAKVALDDKNQYDNTGTIILTVHPSSLSRLRGDKNHNIKRLKEIYPSIGFKIKTDDSLDKSELTTVLENQNRWQLRQVRANDIYPDTGIV